jgi:hypothetical protein
MKRASLPLRLDWLQCMSPELAVATGAPVAIPRPDVLQEVERFIRINQPPAALSAHARLTRESEALLERNFVMYCHIWQTPFSFNRSAG